MQFKSFSIIYVLFIAGIASASSGLIARQDGCGIGGNCCISTSIAVASLTLASKTTPYPPGTTCAVLPGNTRSFGLSELISVNAAIGSDIVCISSVILEPLSTSRQADGFDLAVTQRCPTMIFALCFTGQYVARTDITCASLLHVVTLLEPWGECFRKEQFFTHQIS